MLECYVMVHKIQTQIGVGGTHISKKAKKYVLDVLNSNRLSYGKYVNGFERKFAKLHGAKYAVMSNSGTSSLQVALHTLKDVHNWQDGDEVLVPSVTFIATSNIVLQNNLVPIFVDVDPVTYNIDPNKIESRISARTRAIIPVNLFGLPCEIEEVLRIARDHKLKVLEDSCETMFANYKGFPVGSRSDITCFSTYIAHLLVTGVGGIALTNNEEYAISMKSMLNHGRDSIYLNIDDDKGKIRKDREGFFKLIDRRFSFVRMGYSFRVTELEGALGLAQLEQWKKIISKRKQNAAYLIAKLRVFEEHLQLPTWPDYSEHVFMMFPLVIRKGSPILRDDLVFHLEDHNVETRYMLPLLNQPYYVKLFGNLEEDYPEAAHINRNGFYIGCHQALKQRELDYVVSIFEDFFGAHK